jgi:hypothetical protein
MNNQKILFTVGNSQLGSKLTSQDYNNLDISGLKACNAFLSEHNASSSNYNQATIRPACSVLDKKHSRI